MDLLFISTVLSLLCILLYLTFCVVFGDSIYCCFLFIYLNNPALVVVFFSIIDFFCYALVLIP